MIMTWTRRILLIFLIVCFLAVVYYNVYEYKYKDSYEQQSKRVKVVFFFLFLTVLSASYALLEIEIEGKHGWAVKLPTWVYKPQWIVDLLGGKYPTGYHAILLGLFLPISFHFPVFFTEWAWHKEAIVIGALFFFVVMEDFMWFVLNPEYGLRKFNSRNKKIWWHKKWFGPVPDFYLEGMLIAFILLSWGFPYL